MGKYFGTDGIRGQAGSELTAGLAYRAGRALAGMLEAAAEADEARPRVLLGRDTRASGPMLEAALAAGLMAGGADVTLLGVVPTPTVALLTAAGAAAGVMISASHNPYDDNGIKIFGPRGFKLTDAQEQALEAALEGPEPPGKTGAGLGRLRPFEGDPIALYTEHIRAGGPALQGLRLLIDCANGSASATARHIFPALGAACDFMADSPDGLNINLGCGSTHLGALQAGMAAGGYHLGLAFDGDADRLLAVDEAGRVLDGDRILGILAEYLQARGELRGPVAATVVSNLGLHAFLQARGLGVTVTPVGDRYVLEAMRREGCNLGGEQSGHVIFLDRGNTGDGQLTAVLLLAALSASGQAASALAGRMSLFPQVTLNLPVPNALKARVPEFDSVRQAEERVAQSFGAEGRILIRPSGTEPKVRIMVEGRDAQAVERAAQAAARAIADEVSRLAQE